MRVGVDIGGTFTDAVSVDDDGRIRTAKVLTTPRRLHDGVLQALERLEVDWGRLDSITHGTTAGLNAFLERRGAKVALLTTRGFRDVYELGRANRPDMYNVRYRQPAPLVPRRWIFEIDERVGADGSVLVPTDDDVVRALGRRLATEFEAVAVCFLHSYANPEHEQRVAEMLANEAPSLAVVCSHEIAPEWREYERTSTTAIAAYVAPIVQNYLAELEQQVTARGLRGPLRVMQSNGGVMMAAMARRKAIQTLFSGPVGGTIACIATAEDLRDEMDVSRLICIDMGGTSFDVSLVVDGEADVELESELERHPVLSPTVAIHTIGAGGGSVGHVSAGGLRVGPRSAGAEPGPACYGSGGVEPTVTDANLHLGRLPSVARLAGGMALDEAAAEAALRSVGDTLGLDAGALATGMVAVADSTMANAIREITVLRGIDPRSFALVAFGGAGPLHAAAIADELEIDVVLVPADPGVLSAYGMLHADIRHDVVQSFYVGVAETDGEALEATLTELAERARLLVKEDGVDERAIGLEPSADLRYVGQEYTVTLPLPAGEPTAQMLAELPQRFAEAHEVRYGHSNPAEDVEFVNLRMTARGSLGRPEPVELPRGDAGEPTAVERTWFDGSWLSTPVHRREALPAGATVPGPAIVLEDACTTLVPPAWTATVSAHGHLVLRRS
ncbi:MAG: hydantoinase/oxoprolinase family protein [Acidimicrobiia bacterium]|nr:hydantoinase/oxoprolinase family protein [Acidimicrobiia bacterium]